MCNIRRRLISVDGCEAFLCHNALLKSKKVFWELWMVDIEALGGVKNKKYTGKKLPRCRDGMRLARRLL